MLARSLNLVSVACFAVCVAIVAFSVWSHYAAFDLRGPFGEDRSFAAVAMQGRVMVVVTPARSWPWMFGRYSIDRLMEFPAELVRPKFPGLNWDFPLPGTVRVMVPLWIPAVAAAIPAGVARLCRGWRFTVKELLVITTLLAVLLAMIARMK